LNRFGCFDTIYKHPFYNRELKIYDIVSPLQDIYIDTVLSKGVSTKSLRLAQYITLP